MSSLRGNGGRHRYDTHRDPERDEPDRGPLAWRQEASLVELVGLPVRERLIAAMGLAYDPFSSGATERDLAPDFSKVYVDLLPKLLQALQQPEASVVLGDYGMGKTATRLALEFALRQARTPRALCVTYTPQINDLLKLPGAQSEELDELGGQDLLGAHLRGIAQEASTDLVVQLIERLPEREPELAGAHGQIRRHGLGRQARAASPTLHRLLRSALRSQGVDGALWRGLRPVVRYVECSRTWHELVQFLVVAANTGAEQATWEETLYDARALGFGPVFVLVDAIDDGSVDPQTYFRLIRPLLAEAGVLQQQGVYLKCFLPLAVKDDLEKLIQAYKEALTPPIRLATINLISDVNLHRLVDERLIAASTSMASLSSLDQFGQRLEESVQDYLVTLAAGSPRRMIELVSALLDFHGRHGFRDGERLWLTPGEWEQFQRVVEHQSPPPL